MYILGIDTIFRLTGAALVKEDNSVFYNEIIELDLSNVEADYFINNHINNILALVKKIPDNIWKDIKVIAVVNEPGAFHSLPIGVTAARVLGAVRNIPVIGVNHIIGHIYSNWINRNEKEFTLPAIVLNISGAHNAIHRMNSHADISTLYNMAYTSERDVFPGITNLFEWICSALSIELPRAGSGGAVLSSMALNGSVREFPEFRKIKWTLNQECVQITNTWRVINYIKRRYKKQLLDKQFQLDFAASFSHYLYGMFAREVAGIALDNGAKEIHLVGGIAANPILRSKMETAALDSGLKFKAPLEESFCLDNAAMAAIAGAYKYKYAREKGEDIVVKPDEWFYRYYFRKMFQ